MLKKEYRLSKRKDFEEIKAKGKLKNGKLFSVVGDMVPTKIGSVPTKQFAVVVSKKISKKAVERNQIRRKMYLTIGKNMEIFPAGFRGIFLVKKNILGKSEEEMETCLKSLF